MYKATSGIIIQKLTNFDKLSLSNYGMSNKLLIKVLLST